MPVYQYTALDESGKKEKGRIETEDKAELQRKLKAESKYLLEAVPDDERRKKQLRTKELADFAHELGALVGAGIPLVRALGIISEEETLKPNLRQLCIRLDKAVRRGEPLSQAMRTQGGFPQLMTSMISAAEASGNLAGTLAQLAEHYKKESKLTGKIKASTMYPRIVVVILVLAFFVVMYYVMPQFDELFAGLASLPAATRFLIWLSDVIQYRWWLVLLLIGALVGIWQYLKRCTRVRFGIDKIKLRLPLLGKLMKTIYTARFARTMASLYACGISIVSALQIARSTIGNAYIEAQFDELIACVRSGKPLSDALSRVDGFQKKLASSTRIGEESGELTQMLQNIADTYEHESEISMDKLIAFIEPAMIIIMAVAIAFFMLAVITPIYDSIAAIQ